MTITEYIYVLESIRARHGNLSVYQGSVSQVSGAVCPARLPTVEHLAILTKRQSVPRIWSKYTDTPGQVGEKIVKVGL